MGGSKKELDYIWEPTTTCKKWIFGNGARLVAHKEIKHNHLCDINKIFCRKYEDDNFEKLIEFVHENGVRSFTDDDFDVLERNQLLESRNDPNTIKKANLLKISRNNDDKDWN